jgi:hydroxyacylglutathione hydrolase
MFFRQVRGRGDNFSYVLADMSTLEAAVVDTSFNSSKIETILAEGRFSLRYIFSTHGHWDHVAENAVLRSAKGGLVVAHRLSDVDADVEVKDGDILHVGSIAVKVIHTPGHSPDGICLLVNGEKLLTGDTLFVGECGRTDLPGGDSRLLYDSLFHKILSLNDDVEVYPGHDYGRRPNSTIGEERRTNYVLEPRSEEEFVEFMKTP